MGAALGGRPLWPSTMREGRKEEEVFKEGSYMDICDRVTTK